MRHLDQFDHGHEVFQRIVRQLVVERRVDRMSADIADQKRVAVRLGLLHGTGCDLTTAARAIFHNNRIADVIGDLGGNQASDLIGDAPGGERQDQGNGSARKILRVGNGRAKCAERYDDKSGPRIFHILFPSL